MKMSICVTGWFQQRRSPFEGLPIKFNRYSMTFNSHKRFKESQRIFINLEAGHHCLRELNARVEHCERSGPYYQTQVSFILERPDKKPYREAISVLKAIEAAVPASIRSPLHMSA